MTKDYTITAEDGAGRTCELSIDGATMDRLVRIGYSPRVARESLEMRAYQNAIAAGLIGADSWDTFKTVLNRPLSLTRSPYEPSPAARAEQRNIK